jgi:hypothetical protein
MFETAKWWADGIKVLGGGNDAGLLAAGAALNTFHDHRVALWFVKGPLSVSQKLANPSKKQGAAV